MRENDVCICGHARSEHYTYCLNGQDQSHCKACDPMASLPSGNYAIESGSDFDRARRSADHDFQLLERGKEAGHD